jgi:hypothetical protein
MKKTKIMVSIFTFCVAVLALCFGVYAAITINFKVGGTVHYEVNNAKVEVTTTLYKSAFKANSAYNLKVEADKGVQNEGTWTTPQGWVVAQDLNGEDDAENPETLGSSYVFNSDNDTWVEGQDDKVSGLKVDYVADVTHSYFVVIQIKNLGAVNAYARITSEVLGEGINSHVYASAGYSVIKAADAEQGTEAETKTIVIALSLDDKNVGIGDGETGVKFDYVIEMGAGVMPTNLVALDKDGALVTEDANNTQAFWGVQMGYTYAEVGNPKSAKNPVFWRLVSIDNGVSPYEFNAEVPAGLGVFVLETNVLENKKLAEAHEYINDPETMEAINVGTSHAIYKNIKEVVVVDNTFTNDGFTIEYVNKTKTDNNGTPEDYTDDVVTVDANAKGKFFILSDVEALNWFANARTNDLNDYGVIDRTATAWDVPYLLRTSGEEGAFLVGAAGVVTEAVEEGLATAAAVRPAFYLAV